MDIKINSTNSTSFFNLSFTEPGQTDDLIEQIKKTRFLASR